MISAPETGKHFQFGDHRGLAAGDSTREGFSFLRSQFRRLTIQSSQSSLTPHIS